MPDRSDHVARRAERTEKRAAKIELVPEQRARERRIVMGLLVLILAVNSVVAWDTRHRVEGQIEVLTERNLELAEQVEELEELLDIAVDYVVQLATQVQALGGDPGEIRIQTDPGD